MGLHGQGTVAELPDGRFKVAVTMADGRRVWRRARTRKAAEKIRRELVDRRELELDPGGQTLAEWLRSWLASLADGRRVRRRTLDHYAMIAESHIIPTLGRVKLERLSERAIQAWLDADPGSPRTVSHHRAVLRRALNVAVRQRVIARNPAIAVELPRVGEYQGDPLSLDEVRALFALDDRMTPLWRLAIDTGLREAELLGLTWDDIGPDAVTVTSQLQRIDGEWVRTPTKAARSLAEIAISPATARALEAHRARMAEDRTPEWAYFGHVFVTPAGRPYHGKELLAAFHAACDAAGLRRRRFHDLRHTAATLMRDLGVSEDTRQARLGHSTTAMARHYGRASTDQDRRAADVLGEALSR
jgi:integrase